MVKKDIKISEDNWNKLIKLKMEKKLKSMDLVIESLLNNSKDTK
jgi:hypothetical protein